MARILLGIGGSIAAYRSPDLIKELRNSLCLNPSDLRVVLTSSAQNFVTSKTLETFAGSRVLSNDVWDSEHQGTDHIEGARWAEVIFVYGATANFMAKLAQGFCDDFLSLQILASRALIVLAPAMNVEMWKHPATQENYKKLMERGVSFVGPVSGALACGEHGVGHIASHEEILNILKSRFCEPTEDFPQNYFKGKKILLSLGAMRSSLDAVRFLQNTSSGKMGLEIAKALRQMGALVSILAGQVDAAVEKELESFTCLRFESYADYRAKLLKNFADCDAFFSLAAVLDFVVKAYPGKLERQASQSVLSLEVESTEDMVATCAQKKKSQQKIIAFALESGSWEEALKRAHSKLLKKNADYMVVNRCGIEGEGPGASKNHLYLMDPQGQSFDVGTADKATLATALCQKLSCEFSHEHSHELAQVFDKKSRVLGATP